MTSCFEFTYRHPAVLHKDGVFFSDGIINDKK